MLATDLVNFFHSRRPTQHTHFRNMEFLFVYLIWSPAFFAIQECRPHRWPINFALKALESYKFYAVLHVLINFPVRWNHEAEVFKGASSWYQGPFNLYGPIADGYEKGRSINSALLLLIGSPLSSSFSAQLSIFDLRTCLSMVLHPAHLQSNSQALR